MLVALVFVAVALFVAPSAALLARLPLACPHQPPDRAHIIVTEIHPDATLQPARKHEAAVAYANEATHGQAYGIEKLNEAAKGVFGA